MQVPHVQSYSMHVPTDWSNAGTMPEGNTDSLREGFRHVRYFLPYLRGDLGLIVAVVGLGLAAIFLRLPIMYLPVILTAHDRYADGAATDAGANEWMNWPIRGIINMLRSSFGTPGYLTAAVTIAFAGVLILSPLQLIRSYGCAVLGSNLLLKLRKSLYENLKNLSMLAVYERGAGAFVQRLTRDLLLVYEFFAQTLIGLIGLILYVLIYLTALLLMEWQLTVIVLIAYLALQPFLLMIGRRIQRQSAVLQELHEELTTHMLESVGGYRDIAATGQFERMAQRFRERAERLRKEGLRALLWSQTGELVLGLSFSVLTVTPYFLMLDRLDSIGQVGYWITYVGLLSCLLPSLTGLWGVSIDLAMVIPSLKSLREMLELGTTRSARQTSDRPLVPLCRKIQNIRFDGVGLFLNGRWILRDLTFEITGGELTAIVGQSGSGKTTIFHLLLRLLEPTAGVITINGIPLADFAEPDLRKMIGFIPQNPFLFNMSIRENILVAAGEAGFTEAIPADVASDAQLDALIRARAAEGGLEASAGYLGMRLSAGERQRIALARLLVQDPPIVVCDEYTANIDVMTAKLIQNMMQTRLAGRTRIVITHELYDTRGAQRILVLDGGRIVQSGSHAALMTETGLYRTMCEAQRID